MVKIPRSTNLFFIIGGVGLAAFLFGLYYNFANYLHEDSSQGLASALFIGYALMAIAPMFLRAYLVSLAMFAAVALFVGLIALNAVR